MIKIPRILMKRNIIRNADMMQYGFRWTFENKDPKIIQFIKRKFYIFFQKLQYVLSKKVDIPHIEFVLTTRCTLRCKNCANYIPLIKNHSLLSLEDFKNDIEILLKNCGKIHSLILLGGEPLLIKNFSEYIEFAVSKRKINKIYIFSNGTIIPDMNLIKTLEKYDKKVVFWLSNYTQNKELKNKLKTDEIISLFEKFNINFEFEKNTKWAQSNPPKENNRDIDELKAYYNKCLHPCVSIIEGRMCACPRAVAFYKNKTCNIDESEFLNIRDEKFSPQQLSNWYLKDYYSFCNYCNWIEDCAMEQVNPAEQL